MVDLTTRACVITVPEQAPGPAVAAPARLPARVVVPAGMAIAGVGAFLRLWQLGALGFNSDEAVYAGQAASIAGDPTLKAIFPVFRAHPLLYQFLLALLFRHGSHDLVARLLAVAFGLATVYLVYRLGRLLYGQAVGLLAAALLALCPYHVVVTRQVLLDGPLTFFATLTLYLLATFVVTGLPAWLYAAGAGLGLTFLAKETGLVFAPATYTFLALVPGLRVRRREVAGWAVCAALVVAPFPLSLLLGGGGRTAQGFLVWQLFRQPNHDWNFYLVQVSLALGPLLLLAALLALAASVGAWSWRETLLACWAAIPLLFFQVWPVKGFQYELPVAVVVAVLAARLLVGAWPARAPRRAGAAGSVARGLAVVVLLASLGVASWARVSSAGSTSFLAGSGGVPGGREAGRWLQANTPPGSRLLTIGPSMSNILAFYGHRRGYGLSVSPNPLRRNPAYEPVQNPDLLIRSGEVQYLVWDSFTAARTPFFTDHLLRYVRRYHGRAVHTETVAVRQGGVTVAKPVIVIYRVRP
ncbi:MAG TPA: glycosyltransferase family 39 protein [Actinomycetes bacterium]